MAEHDVAGKRPGIRRIVARIVFSILLVSMAAYGVLRYLAVRDFESTDNAFIEASVVRISSQVPGRVASLPVSENQAVGGGDTLAEIDARPYETGLRVREALVRTAERRLETAELAVNLARATAEAGVEQARAGLDAARKMVSQAQSEVAAADAQSSQAQNDVARYSALEESAISRQRKEQADAMATVARARLEQARKQVETAQAQVGAAQGTLAMAETGPLQVGVNESQTRQAAAELEQTQAAADAARLDLSFTKISAPLDGYVTKKVVHEGEFVQPGQTLMAVVSKELWVVANFKETQIAGMRAGQNVDIYIDAYHGLVLKGHIDSLQTGAGARFSLLPPENATGNYVKVVQRIPVKIRFNEVPDAGLHLGPGMSVVPMVKVR